MTMDRFAKLPLKTAMTPADKARRFPLGAAITLAELDRDPYPAYARLRENEPISWLPALGMWYVTRHTDVKAILLDSDTFTTDSDHSTIVDTFGAQMLTVEGEAHDRYRKAFQPSFMPGAVRRTSEAGIVEAAHRLIDGFANKGEADFRTEFAARLPIQTMLLTFGLPLEVEPQLRVLYDSFEKALANFTGVSEVRDLAKDNVVKLHLLFDSVIDRHIDKGLLPEEIKRNMSIIFFGGISTVEALILNSLRVLLTDANLCSRIKADHGLIPKFLNETMRWAGPVQSATRHVTRDIAYNGVEFVKGDTVNCMIAAANHDPAAFAEPETFNIDRPGLAAHLGFAMGSHHCMGLHFAIAQARIAICTLLDRLKGLQLVDVASSMPTGHEFRQPKSLRACWPN